MVADITTTLLAAFNAVIGGIGTGIVDLFESLILNTAGDGLSSFGLWIFALMGVALAVGVFTRLMNKVA